MHDTLADPLTPAGFRAARRRTPRQTLNTLTTQLRLQPMTGARRFEWTVDVSGMCDTELDTVVEMLVRRGLQATWVRELGWFAHFILRW